MFGPATGLGLNTAAAHSGVCSQPELKESWAAEGSWADPPGSIAAGERRGQLDTLPSEARGAHGDRETKGSNADQWVPGSARGKTATTPGDCAHTPRDTRRAGVPLREEGRLSGNLNIPEKDSLNYCIE